MLAAALLMDLLQSILDWVIFLLVSAVQTVVVIFFMQAASFLSISNPTFKCNPGSGAADLFDSLFVCVMDKP